MQYKVSPIDALWSLKDGPPIRLWGKKEQDLWGFETTTKTSKSYSFCLIWENDATKSIEKEKFINGRLSKYVEFWRMGMCKDETYTRKLDPYMDYWKKILDYIVVKTFANSKFNLLGRFLAFKQSKI